MGNVNNVVVGIATAFIQPWSATVPAVLPPENSIDLGGDWTNGGALAWSDMGVTDQGWTLSAAVKANDITVEEQATPVLVLADSKSVTISGTLAEDTIKSMLWAYGGGTLTTVAPGTTQIGKTTLNLQTALSTWAMGLETVNEYGFFRRILLPKGNVTSSPQTKFRRSAEKRMYDFTFTTTCPVEQIQIVEKTAVHT